VKIRRIRAHKVRPGEYESIDIGASVEIDTEDPEFKNMDIEEIREDLDAILDDLVDKDVNRALKLGGTMEESHLWDFYEKD
jgi:hypothetical protein